MTEASTRPVGLITGASQGLGATLARLLVSEGYELIVTARDGPALSAQAARWSGADRRVVPVAGDVADPGHRESLARAVEEAGRLDLLVNNASELGPSPRPPLADYPLPEFRRVLEVNVVAPLALTQSLLPALQRSHGRVVNISSDAAVGAYERWGGYGASKAALDLLSRTLAAELRGEGVSVVSVDPGDLRTAMHQRAYPGEDISDRPPPDVTIPFWAWFLQQDPPSVSGRRFRAQAERWELPA